MGLNFIPTPFQANRKMYLKQLRSSIAQLGRSMRLKYMFRNSDNAEPINRRLYRPNPTFVPEKGPLALERYLRKVQASALQQLYKISPTIFKRRNYTRLALQGLKTLAAAADVVIRPADKNLGPALLTRSWYNEEGLRQLRDQDTYEAVTEEQAFDAAKQYAIHVQREVFTPLYRSELADNKTLDFLKSHLREFLDRNPLKFPTFYHMPKLHKPGKLKGRPIVASHSALTTPLSTWLDQALQPYAQRCDTALKNSTALVRDLEQLHLPNDCVLLTADVASLYPSIPIEEGIETVQEVLQDFQMPTALLTIVIAALRLVLTNNYFTFLDQIYHQLRGTAMGTPVAPAFAILFLYALERRLPQLYLYLKRYIDDIFGIFKTKEDALQYAQAYNNMHPDINIEWKINTKVDFLDLHIYKGARFATTGLLDLSTHGKKLNPYLYLPFRSYHPVAMKKGFIHGELLRYIRNSSDFKTFHATRLAFYHRLRARGYPHRLICEVMDKVKYKDRQQLLQVKPPAQQRSTPLLLAIVHNPVTHSLRLGRIVRDHWSLINEDPALQHLFPAPPIIAQRRTDNIGDFVQKASKRGGVS
jgi:hypothetical protein